MRVDLPDIGDSAVLEAQFSEADVDAFAALSGDTNPLHLESAEGKRLGFDGRIVHGMLTASLISRLLGTSLPGRGTVYLSQDLRFLKPVYPRQLLRSQVTVTEKRADKAILTLSTRVWADEELALDGQATVLVRG